MTAIDIARKIADAVLYEGYVLYPYRASSIKNQFRWQFGIVAPQAWSEDGGEPSQMRTEFLVEPQGYPEVEIAVRFLQVEEQAGPDGAPWDTGIERRIDLGR